MRANVQYNDFRGTTAADRSDFLFDNPNLIQFIIERFELPISPEEYEFVGISVYTTNVEDSSVSFIVKNIDTLKIERYHKYSVNLQEILNIFKRFSFQIGYKLEDIDENQVEDIEN